MRESEVMTMGNTVSVDQMADAIMQVSPEVDLATADMKKAVKDASKTVKKEIQAGAPQKSGATEKLGGQDHA